MAQPALFEGTSQDVGRYFHVSMDHNESASLGVKLMRCDDLDDPSVQFYPGYAVVTGFTQQQPHASIRKGDIIVAVNGHGFRRFSYTPESEQPMTATDNDVQLDHTVIHDGTAYSQFMEKYKAVKLALGDPPLVLTLIRYDWDARCFAWRRFLAARQGNVIAALKLYQEHVQWRNAMFPMDMSTVGMQTIAANHAVAPMIQDNIMPTVYVNYGSLLDLLDSSVVTFDDITNAFVRAVENGLAACDDPRYPTISCLLDVASTNYTIRTDIVQALYSIFEPNYPETLHKIILYYPMSPITATTIRALLNFVNETTREKVIVTESVDQVCETMEWDLSDIQAAGGIQAYVRAAC